MSKKAPVSLQLWSLRGEIRDDFAGAMEVVAKAGYKGVEMAGYGNLSPEDAAKAVEDNGLTCSGMHVVIQRLRNELEQVVIEAQLFGAKNIVCPVYPRELAHTAASWTAVGEELDRIGARLKTFGLSLHYHHHEFEFERFDGRFGIEYLLDASRPANLACQADLYWVHVGGKDPAAFIREQGRRIRLVHLKDETELGTGPVDYAPVFDALDSVGCVEWYIIEVERYTFHPFESIRRSFDQLKAWGRA